MKTHYPSIRYYLFQFLDHERKQLGTEKSAWASDMQEKFRQNRNRDPGYQQRVQQNKECKTPSIDLLQQLNSKKAKTGLCLLLSTAFLATVLSRACSFPFWGVVTSASNISSHNPN